MAGSGDMSWHDEWVKRCAEQHAAECAAGKHDEACEYSGRIKLCHCSKRRREAAGYTEPPGELIFNSPSCPRCYEDVVHDGDTFGCEPCCVTWDERGIEAEFTDDYGTIDSDS